MNDEVHHQLNEEDSCLDRTVSKLDFHDWEYGYELNNPITIELGLAVYKKCTFCDKKEWVLDIDG